MHGFIPLNTSPYAVSFLTAYLPFIILVALWTLLLKGFALWYAARDRQKWWFIALLVINTMGILEIIYLIWFCPSDPIAKYHAHRKPGHKEKE